MCYEGNLTLVSCHDLSCFFRQADRLSFDVLKLSFVVCWNGLVRGIWIGIITCIWSRRETVWGRGCHFNLQKRLYCM